MNELGERLKELRNNKGLTQKQLGALIHKSKAAVGSYEQGIQTRPTDVLISLARIFHVSVDDLIGFKCGANFIVEGLTSEQCDVIESLINEFEVPTSNGELSEKQLEIINRIIRLFINHHR